MFVYMAAHNLHSANDKLTEDEKIKKENSLEKSYYLNLTDSIMASPMAKKFDIIDLTLALENKNKNSQIFADWHHLNAEGNMLIAEAIKELLDQI